MSHFPHHFHRCGCLAWRLFGGLFARDFGGNGRQAAGQTGGGNHIRSVPEGDRLQAAGIERQNEIGNRASDIRLFQSLEIQHQQIPIKKSGTLASGPILCQQISPHLRQITGFEDEGHGCQLRTLDFK